MRIKRKLKIFAIGVVILVTLLLLFVTAFIYDPMEGSLADMREVVPRNVDFFVRKTDLKDDFTRFPEPHFWAPLTDTESWRKLERLPMVKGFRGDGGFEAAIDELRNVSEEIVGSSRGMLDLLDDVIGTEAIVAGRFVPPTFDRSRYCAYARVSWKVRFLWGLLGWSSVRDSVSTPQLQITALENGTFELQTGGQKIWLGRHLDCLMIANDQDLLDKSIALARGETRDDTFGQSAIYRDGIEARLGDWGSLYEGLPVNALELYARPDQLFQLTKWDDGWPNQRQPDDMNERVLASFLNLTAWRFLSGSVLFQPDSLTLLARVDLNRNQHTGFQAEFFRAESAPYDDWLKPFLAMVPEGVGSAGGVGGRGACAAAALRVNAADFLVEMYEALDDRTLIDDPLKKTGKYTGARDLIDKLRTVLLPRTGFVFMRKQDLDVEVFEPSPAPHFAWVFWIRREQRGVLEELRDYLSTNRDTLGFTDVKDLRPDRLTDPCREFWSPHIPGTGMIAMMIYGDFFILSNSSFLALDMIRARLNSQSLLQHHSWEIYEKELPNKINGLVFLNGDRLANVFSDYVREVDEGSRQPDPSWMLANRNRIEQRVFEAGYSQHGSIARIPPAQQPEFDAAVDREMNAEWIRQRASFTAQDRTRYEELRTLSGMLDSAYLQVELDPQFIQMTAGILMDR